MLYPKFFTEGEFQWEFLLFDEECVCHWSALNKCINAPNCVPTVVYWVNGTANNFFRSKQTDIETKLQRQTHYHSSRTSVYYPFISLANVSLIPKLKTIDRLIMFSPLNFLAGTISYHFRIFVFFPKHRRSIGMESRRFGHMTLSTKNKTFRP